MIATITSLALTFVGAEEHEFDDAGYTSADPILPHKWEMIIGSTASIIVFILLYKFAWPVMKQSFNNRTAGIQQELDDAQAAKVTAEGEAATIRQAQGNIEAERERLHAEAAAQAEALLADGRARLDVEMADLETRAEADIAAAAGRSADELRAEIARHSSVAVERIVHETLDDATQQALIEGFIQRVGASTGANS
jgi:F-type H+-transporting ATPase subunit b